MKNLINVFIMLVATFAAGNAQLFVEGNARVTYRDYEIANFNNQFTQFSIEISPKAGYWLTDHIAVGSNVSYSIGKAKTVNNNPDSDGVFEDIRSEYGFSVFSRYKIQMPKRFSLLFESSLGVRRNIQKGKNIKDEIARKVSTTSLVNVIIFPAISYDLSDRFSLVASCESLSFGLGFGNTKIENTGQKLRNNNIGFNTQSTIFNSISNIQLGFIYNF